MEAKTSKQKAEFFSKYFVAVSTPKIKRGKAPKKMKYKEAKDEYNKLFCLQELVDQAIKELDTQRAPGADGIHAEFLQNSGPLFRQQLLSVINKSWICQVPKQWKVGRITPILKKDKDANQTSSYRPIALTSVLAKTAERMVAYRLTTFLEEKNFICPQQATIRKNRSTIDQVTYIAQQAMEGFAIGETTIVVSIDLTAAFDVTDRGHVIREMKRYKVPHNIT